MNRRHFVKHLAGVSALSFVGKVKAQEEKLKKSGKKTGSFMDGGWA